MPLHMQPTCCICPVRFLENLHGRAPFETQPITFPCCHWQTKGTMLYL